MKFTLSCIVIYVHMCLARNFKTDKNSLRIMGGRNATEDEFPYVVKLMLQSLAARTQSNLFLCSCAVLTSKWTLTAGHCITGLEQVMFGNGMVQTKAVIEYQPSSKADVVYSEVMSTVIPPAINFHTVKNDIGLLHTQPILFAKYAKLSPIDYASLNGQEVSIVGYGMIKEYHENPPLLPQVLEVIVKECPSTYHYPQMCFAPSCAIKVSKAICLGDSGGPAVHASGVVSVNSMTDIRNCGMSLGSTSRRDRYDTGYDVGTATPISPFLDWISTVMNKENVS